MNQRELRRPAADNANYNQKCNQGRGGSSAEPRAEQNMSGVSNGGSRATQFRSSARPAPHWAALHHAGIHLLQW